MALTPLFPSQCLLYLNDRAHSLNTKASCFINGVPFISCFHADNLPRERKGIQVARPQIQFSYTHEQFTSGYFTAKSLSCMYYRVLWEAELPSQLRHPPPKAPVLPVLKVIGFRFWFNQPSVAILTIVLSTGQTSSYTNLLPWQKSPSQTKSALAIPLTVCRNANLFPGKDKPM